MDGKIGSGLAILMVSALPLMTSCDKKLPQEKTLPQTSPDASASKTAPQEVYWKTFIAETAEEEGKAKEANVSGPGVASHPVRFTVSKVSSESNAVTAPLKPDELPLSELPYWRREPIRLLREKKAQILRDGKAEGEAIKGGTAQERNKWLVEWNRRNRDSFQRIDAEEREILTKRVPDPSSPDRMRELIEKIQMDSPAFDESDILPLEQLLPPEKELRRPEIVQNSRISELLRIHSMLADHYPRSVTRPDISKFYLR